MAGAPRIALAGAGLCLALAGACAQPATAYWRGVGAGAASAVAATMPAGGSPAVTVAGQTVTVAWAQSSFQGAPLGGFTGGGYTVTRALAGGGAAAAATGGCGGIVAGSAATVQCSESGVAYGDWTYAVTPVLGTWTGATGTAGAAAHVVPPAPAGTVSAVAGAARRIDVTWSAVAGVPGYDVYRRTAAGTYDFSAPLNGATPVTATTWADTTGVDGTGYVYAVRSVATGASGALVESASSADSNVATADGTPPPAPTASAVTSGGPVLATATCGVAAGTRYVNAAGRTAVGVSATIAAPETGETVVFTATTAGSTPVSATVAASGTSVTATLDLSSLRDGVVTLTARTQDAAGNQSAAKAPANAVVKDTVGGALSNLTYTNVALFADSLNGTSECGARITAVETAGPNVGKTFPTSGTFTVGAAGTFSGFTVDAVALGAYGYRVTATDLAGNAGTPVSITGTDLL